MCDGLLSLDGPTFHGNLDSSADCRKRSDEKLFKHLGAELTRTLGPGATSGDDLDVFVRRLGQLPRGLRTMAATYELDVSMTLDDLGWHFARVNQRASRLLGSVRPHLPVQRV